MKIKTLILVIVAAQMAFASPSFAIEGLTISIDCPDVVLRWPSVEGETYIVQHRDSLDTNSAWETLTNFYPAFTGTNWTTFTHPNQVTCTTNYSGGGTNVGGDGPPSPGNSSSTSFSTTKKNHKYPPMPALPPLPWEQSSFSKTSTTSGYSMNDANGASGAEPVEMGSYRVVRNGVFIVGVTNGATIGGKVPLFVEVGLLEDENVSGSAITAADGAPVRGLAQPSTEDSQITEFLWDTTQTQNGTYNLLPQVDLGLETSVTGAVKTVTVYNDVRFSTGFPLAGTAMRIEAQTIHTNGTWTMDVFDDQNSYVGYLSGDVDGNGFCAIEGDPGPGFSVSLTDTNGDQLPSSFYNIVMTTSPSGANGAATNTTGTTKIFVEQAWNIYTKYAVAYQPIYTKYTQADFDLFEMMANVVAQCRLRWPSYVQDAVVNSLDGNPFQLRHASDWIQLSLDLRKVENGQRIVRNFFYFGHGNSKRIGFSDPNLQLTDKQLLNLFRNNPSEKTNAQPFRFVFLDGCATGKGHLCKYFGIPEDTYTAEEFVAQRGLRPRAFLGWKDILVIGIQNVLSANHKKFIEQFYTDWPVVTAGVQTRLQDAITSAAIDKQTGAHYTPLDTYITLYGCPDLYFYEGP